MKLTRLMTAATASTLALIAGCGSSETGLWEREARLVLAPDSRTISEGADLTMALNYINESGTSTNVAGNADWTSGDTNVATIEVQENAAKVTGVDSGETVITARFNDLSAQATIFVEASLASIEVSPHELTLALGMSGKIDATGIRTNNAKRDVSGEVVWSSSDPSVADVGTAGELALEAAGPTTISASQDGDVVGSASVNVIDDALDELTIEVARAEMLLGTDQPVITTGTFGGQELDLGPFVDFTITDQSLEDGDAEGDVLGFEGGVVTALQAGSATFEASFEVDGNEAGTSTESITIEVLGAGVNPSQIEIFVPSPLSVVGEPVTIVAEGSFADHDPFRISGLVDWQTSDEAPSNPSTGLAVLRLRGLQATAQTAGSVKLVSVWPIEGGEDVRQDATIQVIDDPASSLAVEADGSNVTATATFGSATQDVTSAAYWVSSNPDCAFVDNAAGRSGTVTVIDASDCGSNDTISARYRGVEASIDVSALD